MAVQSPAIPAPITTTRSTMPFPVKAEAASLAEAVLYVGEPEGRFISPAFTLASAARTALMSAPGIT
jgi:hypothetical protein